MTDLPPLPTFIIIGAQKSGTRWLRYNLGEHPAAHAPPTEPKFFNRDGQYHSGTDTYRRILSERWSGEPVVGEATPAYMFRPTESVQTAGRIADTIPDVRLFAMLRNPIDRTRSAFLHHIKHRRISRTDTLLEWLSINGPPEDRHGLIVGGRYGANLRPYVEQFGGQLKVFLLDDVTDNPASVFRDALRHIGLSDFVPDSLEDVRYSNERPNSPVPALTLSERQALWAYFEDDVADLERLLGRDLSRWNPRTQ